MSKIYFNDPVEAAYAADLLATQLPYETDKDKELLLSIAKMVYTKLRKSNKMPLDVLEEMGKEI